MDILIRSCKYRQLWQLTDQLGALAYPILREEHRRIYGAPPDVVIPMAIHPHRLRERGYHIPLQITKALGYSGDARAYLRRLRNNPPQYLMRNRAERARNVKGIFTARESELRDKHVVIVDDVVSTGETLSQAAAACKRQGAQTVTGWALARGV